MSQSTAAAAPAAETKVNTFLAKVYLLMFVGLAVTGIVSYWVFANTEFESLLATNPALGWGLFILQVILVHAISVRVMKNRPGSRSPALPAICGADRVGHLGHIPPLFHGPDLHGVYHHVGHIPGYWSDRDGHQKGYVRGRSFPFYAIDWLVFWPGWLVGCSVG